MKNALASLLTLAAAAAVIWGIWMWGFCRFYVEPDHMAVITAKTGSPLPPDQILAQIGQRGVQEEVLAEGRHFLNPWLYSRQIVPVITIPPGKIGVVLSKVGAELPEGEFLANQGQKGIWRRVLGPGKYRLNPVGYQVDIVDAVSIPIGYAGVVTSLSGAQAPEGQFAGPRQKGVREDILQPGLYYLNPREFKVDVIEIGVNQVSLLGRQGSAVITKGQLQTQNVAMDELQRSLLDKQQEKRASYLAEAGAGRSAVAMAPAQMERADQRQAPEEKLAGTFILNQFVEFPSRDGFEISLDMTVEFELLPKNVAQVFRGFGDLPAVVDKIIMPQILSVSRMKGSAYGARDFIVGEGRERFQAEITEALAKILLERRIVIHSVLIRHVNVPGQILEPIQMASIATEQDLTNKEKQNTARKQAELNTELALIDQRRGQVAQETEKLKAEIRADQEKQVAEIQADTTRQTAEIEKETAAVRAERVTRIGEAEADVIRLVEGERARGHQLKVAAFKDPQAYNLWRFADSLNEKIAVRILHAGEGTLWTDLEKARMGDLGGANVIQRQP